MSHSYHKMPSYDVHWNEYKCAFCGHTYMDGHDDPPGNDFKIQIEDKGECKIHYFDCDQFLAYQIINS